MCVQYRLVARQPIVRCLAERKVHVEFLNRVRQCVHENCGYATGFFVAREVEVHGIVRVEDWVGEMDVSALLHFAFGGRDWWYGPCGVIGCASRLKNFQRRVEPEASDSL